MPEGSGSRRELVTMFSVALIGADGAGKTSIAKALLESLPIPTKYLYMGINSGSSNVVLPTTRLLERLKRSVVTTDGRVAGANGSRKRHRFLGSAKSAGRLLVNITEELYRQTLSRHYRRHGYIVLYDRHFRFDFEYDPDERNAHSGCDLLHRWFLARLFPGPDLVIFLDAPAEILYARKHEATPEWLEWRRQQFLKQGGKLANFVRVDAVQPFATVLSEVSEHIFAFHNAWLPQERTSTDAVSAPDL